MELHIKAKVISIHEKMEVLNESEQVVYTVSSKVISIHNKTFIEDASGAEVATILRKPISLHEIHTIEMKDGTSFDMSTKLFRLTDDVITIKELGWTLHGDFLEHNYEIWDNSDHPIAKTHIKWMSIHQIYYIDVLDEQQVDKVIAIFVALEHIMADRRSEQAESAAIAENMRNSGNN